MYKSPYLQRIHFKTPGTVQSQYALPFSVHIDVWKSLTHKFGKVRLKTITTNKFESLKYVCNNKKWCECAISYFFLPEYLMVYNGLLLNLTLGTGTLDKQVTAFYLLYKWLVLSIVEVFNLHSLQLWKCFFLPGFPSVPQDNWYREWWHPIFYEIRKYTITYLSGFKFVQMIVVRFHEGSAFKEFSLFYSIYCKGEIMILAWSYVNPNVSQGRAVLSLKECVNFLFREKMRLCAKN